MQAKNWWEKKDHSKKKEKGGGTPTLYRGEGSTLRPFSYT